ncbi:hypothetical protein RUM44_006725 [Polyplax serrata]|uniref:Dorsal-ventral patterning protein Sog n=1 Tax=Polyplax serrata TaxID=468196 RepID=A0ABR1AIV6_POLSC
MFLYVSENSPAGKPRRVSLEMSEIAQDIPPPEEEKNMKYFGALLTGRTSLVFKRDDIVNIPSTSKNPAYQIVATGRFTFHKKNLYYSFYFTNSLNKNTPRPRTIQFINYRGDLLEEQNLPATGSVYQNSTSKVCGVWRRIPREYKRLLRDETLYVALLWGNNLALSGQIARLKALNTEQFSALLTPPYSDLVEPDGGGTAIISTLASPPTVHVSLVFNGVFLPDDVADVPLTVRLENTEKGYVIFEEIIRVQKPSHTINAEEVKSLISMNELRMITRGKYSISISSRQKPELYYISGSITTRTSCEIFQAPLSPSSEPDGLDAQETISMLSPFPPSSGMAWLYVNRDGSITYNAQITDLQEPPVFTLTPTGKGKKTLDTQQFSPTHVSNGLATGTLDKLSPKLLEFLYAGELSLSVSSARTGRVVKGMLNSRPVAGAVDSKAPALLKRVQGKKTSDLTGMAWLSIDFDCDLYYEVQLSGTGAEFRSYQLFLEDTPMVAPNSPVSKRHLEDFNGTFLEGFTQLTPQELLRMDTGVCFFEIKDLLTGAVLLRADMKQLKIPVECLSYTSDNDVPSFVSMSSHRTMEIKKCYHEGIFYDEGSQWRHPRDPCKMCHCLRGKEKCDDVVCPQLSCPNKIKLSSRDCCPTCYDSSNELKTTVGCTQAGQFYPNGSVWHPYLPPYGFNLCVVMSCVSDAKSSVIKYSRVQCPPLKCSEKEAIRVDKNSCCKQCPTPEVGYARDQSVVVEAPRKKTDEEILQEGGCTYLGRGPYENNTEWSHRVDSIGVTPCVKCRCKDGVIMCERKRCIRANCANNSTTQSNSDVDDCCSHQCRYRRQSKHSQRRKLWKQMKRGTA